MRPSDILTCDGTRTSAVWRQACMVLGSLPGWGASVSMAGVEEERKDLDGGGPGISQRRGARLCVVVRGMEKASLVGRWHACLLPASNPFPNLSLSQLSAFSAYPLSSLHYSLCILPFPLPIPEEKVAWLVPARAGGTCWWAWHASSPAPYPHPVYYVQPSGSSGVPVKHALTRTFHHL